MIFLKYISDAFKAKRSALLQDDLSDAEDPEEYLAENVFWIPKEARWSHLQDNARQATIGKITDDAMLLLEASFPTVEEVEAELGKAAAWQGIENVMSTVDPTPEQAARRERGNKRRRGN